MRFFDIMIKDKNKLASLEDLLIQNYDWPRWYKSYCTSAHLKKSRGLKTHLDSALQWTNNWKWKWRWIFGDECHHILWKLCENLFQQGLLSSNWQKFTRVLLLCQHRWKGVLRMLLIPLLEEENKLKTNTHFRNRIHCHFHFLEMLMWKRRVCCNISQRSIM